MFFENNERLFKEIAELETLERNYLLLQLIESGKLSFVEIAKLYVQNLEKDNSSKSASISSLGLMLGGYCMNDNSNLGKTSRKHLYQSKMYGANDGSAFGKMLDEEFGS